MDFFDEDDAPPEDEPTRRGGRSKRPIAARPEPDLGAGGHVSRQQVRTRQLTFIGASIVVFILLVLAFRGCLDARKERAFKNYVSDLSAIAVESDQLSKGFFDALEGGSSSGDITLGNQVNGDRSTASSLAQRAANLDNPDELAQAQTSIALAFQLRADALGTIADQLDTALGDEGATKAQKQITEQMKVLVASDVLYKRGQDQIEQELTDQEIVVDGGVPKSQFVPTGKNDPNFLELSEIQGLLAGAGASSTGGGGGSGGASCDPGDELTHGLGLISVTAAPSGAALTPDAANTVTSTDTDITATVQNQGDAPETEVQVSVEGDFTGNQTISTIAAGAEETVTIPLKPTPSAGDTGSITVTAQPVCGEQEETNNTFTYDLAFE